MEQQVVVSVANSSEKPSAVAAAPENFHPSCVPEGSILRALLTRDNPSKEAPTTTSTGDKLNLLEGLGDDFFNEPVDEDTIARIIEEIDPATAINNEEAVISLVGATDVIEASPLPPTQQPHFSHTSSSLDCTEVTRLDTEDHQVGPSLSGMKRKSQIGGKGRKIFKPSDDQESSELFSQPEHKALLRDYRNLISQVEEQRQLSERRRLESQKRLTSLTTRRGEAEERLKHGRQHLHRLLEQFEKLQHAIEQQRTKCREDSDLVRSLLGEEAEVRVEEDRHRERSEKFELMLLALRAAEEYA